MVTSEGPWPQWNAAFVRFKQRDVTVCNKAAQVHMDAGMRHDHIRSLGARRWMEAGGALPVKHMTALLRATQEMGGQCFVCVWGCAYVWGGSRSVKWPPYEWDRLFFCFVFLSDHVKDGCPPGSRPWQECQEKGVWRMDTY